MIGGKTYQPKKARKEVDMTAIKVHALNTACEESWRQSDQTISSHAPLSTSFHQGKQLSQPPPRTAGVLHSAHP
jgi:hypothetical protein